MADPQQFRVGEPLAVNIIFKNIGTVSYTHLDVYKRQGCAGGASFVLNVPELKVGVMLSGHEGEPVGSDFGRGGLDNGQLSRGRVNVPLASEAIVEFDDLGRRDNDEPDLLRYWVEKIN